MHFNGIALTLRLVNISNIVHVSACRMSCVVCCMLYRTPERDVCMHVHNISHSMWALCATLPAS